MRKLVALIAALIAAVLFAACSSGPPSPRDLLLKVPGCTHPYNDGVDVPAQAELRCDTPYASVWVATFGSSSDETAWLTGQGAGCECLRGDLWAASVSATSSTDFQGDLDRVRQALGGQQVQVP